MTKDISMKKKRKLTRLGKGIMAGLLAGSMTVAAVSIVQIMMELRQYHAQGETYQRLRQLARKEEEEEQNGIDWEALQQINPQIVGWIYQEGTVIDYPIVCGEDNSYYLTHTFEQESGIFGTIFMDAEAQRDFSDTVTVIYGHHFSGYGDVMFTSLERYADQDYYLSHPTLKLYTPEGNYRLEAIAGVVKAGSEDYIRTSFANEQAFEAYFTSIQNESTFVSMQDVSYTDRFVLLASCTDLMKDGRYGLFCRIVEI